MIFIIIKLFKRIWCFLHNSFILLLAMLTFSILVFISSYQLKFDDNLISSHSIILSVSIVCSIVRNYLNIVLFLFNDNPFIFNRSLFILIPMFIYNFENSIRTISSIYEIIKTIWLRIIDLNIEWITNIIIFYIISLNVQLCLIPFLYIKDVACTPLISNIIW